ncbi:hypothetical protein VTH82DRAFT_4076 [Thermothelomyces myriococcoides]
MAKPLKRKKVVLDPNEKFATIEQIYNAQVEAGRIEKPTDEESDSEKHSPWDYKNKLKEYSFLKVYYIYK